MAVHIKTDTKDRTVGMYTLKKTDRKQRRQNCYT